MGSKNRLSSLFVEQKPNIDVTSHALGTGLKLSTAVDATALADLNGLTLDTNEANKDQVLLKRTENLPKI